MKKDIQIYKKFILYMSILSLFFTLNISNASFVSGQCSSNGYTIVTINGINTIKTEAEYNLDQLAKKFGLNYNNQEIDYQYLFNPTHGLMIDFLDSINQKYFEQSLKNIQDSDFAKMLLEASKKITTQKLLLVAHSQGNFYANTFYDAVADESGGVPSQSIGVYGVATPANHVAGGGKYLTSDTDKMIADFVSSAPFANTLKPNAHIVLKPGDDILGHHFAKIYLNYEGDRMISDIKSSLSRLKNNDEQNLQEPCISAPELTKTQSIENAILSSFDFIRNNTNEAVVYVATKISNTGSFLFNGALYLVKTIGNFTTTSLASVFNSTQQNNISNENLATPTTEDNNNQTDAALADENLNVSPSAPEENLSSEIDTTQTENPTNQDENITPPQTPQINKSTAMVLHGGSKSLPKDMTAPIISIIGDNPLSVEVGKTYTDLGATAIDDVDSTVTVVANGDVDTSIVGTYIKTYTATDLAGNVSMATRMVNVVKPAIADTISPEITINGEAEEFILLNSTYVDAGATALDDIDGVVKVKTDNPVDATKVGDYIVTYTASDLAGNISTKNRNVKVSTYKYIPKYSFGTENGDGNDWQVWSFNGSNIYDWKDIYVDNYLKEEFKIQNYSGQFSSLDFLQRGIFNHDPQKGFELTDIVSKTPLEDSPQGSGSDIIYDVSVQWDSTGYTYTIFYNGDVDSTGHTNISNVNENMWTGWDSSNNNFQTFPSGNWQGVVVSSPENKIGGDGMILQPYPVYKYIGPVLSKEKKITAFNFNNLSPSIIGIIDENTHSVSLNVPFGADIKNLVPTISISDKSSVSPNGDIAQDFTNSIKYIVTAENNSTQEYTVIVKIDPDPNLPPVITSYTLNNYAGNFGTVVGYPFSVPIVMHASKNVNWMSIKIEYEGNQGDEDQYAIYKNFQSDKSDCVDGTNVCKKVWKGELTKGSMVKSGKYKIKVHIKDEAGKEFYDYLSPYIIWVVAPI